MKAGLQDKSYVQRMQALNWDTLYSNHDLGNFLEELREDWKQSFDFVLIDSRTGITDIGGICTIQLPDILMLLLTANDQSLNGSLEVLERIQEAKARFPFDRAKLLVAPIVSRFERRVEYDLADFWLKRFADLFPPIINDWAHKDISAMDLLNYIRIPYIPYWSFGEKLPVIEKGTSDPEDIGFPLETLAALVAQKLSSTDILKKNRDTFVNVAKREPTRIEAGKQEERRQPEALPRKRHTRRNVLVGLGVGLTVAVGGGTALAISRIQSSPTPVQSNATATAQANIVATATTQANIVATATNPVVPPFNVYTDFGDPRNHYTPSGFYGDYGAIKLTENWKITPHSGKTCIQVVYSGIATQRNGWAGVYWQQPENNWGKFPEPTGYNLSHISKLSFWVRGQLGGERIQFLVGGIQGPYGDSLQPAVNTPIITLTTSWQLNTISLEGKNLAHIIGGFAWVAYNTDNPHGATFYLDDIVYSA